MFDCIQREKGLNVIHKIPPFLFSQIITYLLNSMICTNQKKRFEFQSIVKILCPYSSSSVESHFTLPQKNCFMISCLGFYWLFRAKGSNYYFLRFCLNKKSNRSNSKQNMYNRSISFRVLFWKPPHIWMTPLLDNQCSIN